MTIFKRLRLYYLCYFSKPAANRPVYRAIYRHRIRKIVELGIGDASRATRMIEVACYHADPTEIHYVGIDPFETRASSGKEGTSLKSAHQQLRSTGARVQLVPGHCGDALIRLANSLGKVDLLIVPGELNNEASARVWFFVPRMLHENSLVFIDGVDAKGRRQLRLKPRHAIERLAAQGFTRRAA